MFKWLRTRTLPQLAGTVMIVSALTALVYQASKNAVTAAKYSEGWMKYIDAAGGIAVELFVASAAIGVLYVMRRGKISSSYAMFGLIGLCVGFGLLAAGQQISVQRTQKTAEVGVQQNVYGARSAQLTAAQSELATLKARPVSAIEAEIDGYKRQKFFAQSNGCTDVGGYNNSCGKYTAAMKELGVAKRKADLENRIAGLTTAVAATTGGQIATADPIAALLANSAEISTENAQIAMAFFSAVTMMMIAMFGVHFGLIVYGADEMESIRPAVQAAPVVPHNVHAFHAAPQAYATPVVGHGTPVSNGLAIQGGAGRTGLPVFHAA